MSRRIKIISFIAIAALTVCALAIHLDRTQFIHTYTYVTQSEVEQSGLSFSVRFQAGKPMRDEIPERMTGPPWSVVIVVSSPPGSHSIRLKSLAVKRTDGEFEDCRILVGGDGQVANGRVFDATISEGKWGEHTEINATFELKKQDEESELRVNFPIEPSHERILRIPMI